MKQVRVERDTTTNEVRVMIKGFTLVLDGKSAIELGEILLSKGTASVLASQKPMVE